LFNTDVAFCKGDDNIAYINNFDWSDPLVATAIKAGMITGIAASLALMSPVIKQYYANTYWRPVNHSKDYYIERYNDLIENLLDKNLINDGNYLTLYEKIHKTYKSIEGNNEISEVVKLQEYDYLLYVLKNQYIPEILNNLPFS
jgi:hypothetical protein